MANVLVVDDEPGIREYLVEALRRDQHDVTSAESGEAALIVLGKQAIEVLLTDLRMPGMGGLELIRQSLERDPSLEVVVLTAHSSVDAVVDVMRAGATDYLEKPIKSPSDLRHVIRKAAERRQLRTKVEALSPPSGPVLTYGAPAMKPVVHQIERVAPTRASVLLTGESGTGKEVAARELHRQSGRDGPFVAVNCAALSPQLLESELFGHEKGAFTGAVALRRGKIELAEGGTFFLDEVGELNLELQAKLLRVVQERTFERVGGQQTRSADVRWVAATNRDLQKMVDEGTFREDLYYRIAVFPVHIPPLRERREDIGPLAQALLLSVCADIGRRLELTPEAQQSLTERHWRGNVRELRNCLERAAILVDGHRLGPSDFGESAMHAVRPPDGAVATMEEVERQAIERALSAFDGNRKQAAEALGIGVRTLYDKLKRIEQD